MSRMNNNNYQNKFQNNNYQNLSNQNPGYSSINFNSNQPQANNSYSNTNKQLNFSGQVDPQMTNNIRYTEAPNKPYIPQEMNQKDIPRMTEYNKGQERPLWAYRETKYDEYKMPRNTECITTTSIPRMVKKQK